MAQLGTAKRNFLYTSLKTPGKIGHPTQKKTCSKHGFSGSVPFQDNHRKICKQESVKLCLCRVRIGRTKLNLNDIKTYSKKMMARNFKQDS